PPMIAFYTGSAPPQAGVCQSALSLSLFLLALSSWVLRPVPPRPGPLDPLSATDDDAGARCVRDRLVRPEANRPRGGGRRRESARRVAAPGRGVRRLLDVSARKP